MGEFLRVQVVRPQRSVAVAELERMAHAEGETINKSSAFTKAKAAVGVISKQEGFGPGSRCYWQAKSRPSREPQPNRQPIESL